MNERKLAALEIAWVWRCESCLSENYAKSFGLELMEYDAIAMRKSVGEDGMKHLRGIPANVRCKSCGERYKTRA